MSQNRFWSSISVVTALTFIAEPAFACGLFDPPRDDMPPDPPPTWIKFSQENPAAALFGVQLNGLFPAKTSTDCVCGLSLFDKTNPQGSILASIPSFDVSGVTFAITNTKTNESRELVDMDGNPIFAMERDTSLDNGLANNEFTPDSSIGYSAISNNADNWFGFSAIVEPFTPPTLGDNEVFTMLFDIDFDPGVRQALLGLGLQFASGKTSDPLDILDPLHLHPVAYSGEAMVMENENIPEPSSILSLLALGTLGAASTLKRKLKSSKSIEKEVEKASYSG